MIQTKKWRWFKVSELFDKPYKGTAYNAQDLTICNKSEKNAIRYVTRTDTNNGCKGFVINNGFENIERGNAITIGDTTSTIFYQAKDFICGDHIVVLRSAYLNTIRGMFLSVLLNHERYRYNYGRAFKKELIYDTEIKLPIDNDNSPDWQWIEHYIKRKIIPSIPSKAKSVWEKRFNYTPIHKERIQLHTNEWSKFKYNDIFQIKKGKRLTKSDMIVGAIPYIGAIDSNNGISSYIANNNYLHSANTITVSYNGSIAEAFYQTTEFWATDDVNVLYPRFPLNKYIALFLTTIINKEKYRFNYGRKWDKELMEESIIKLPVDSSGNPDWKWMEDYIKSLPYSRCL